MSNSTTEAPEVPGNSPQYGRPPSPPDAALQRRSRLKLLAVLGAFGIPLLLATVWLHYARVSGGTLGLSARGELIHPAFPLESVVLSELNGEQQAPFDEESLRGTWTMFYAPAGECGEACELNIYHMRQVRLALSHRMDRVQRVLLVNSSAQVDADLLAEHPGLRVLSGTSGQYDEVVDKINTALSQSKGALQPADAIYLIDPFANVMMRFPADLPPKSMLKDIKHLLKVSRIG